MITSCLNGLYRYLALHRASNSGSYDLAVGLIKNGADVNAKTDDGWIPLHSGNVLPSHFDIISGALFTLTLKYPVKSPMKYIMEFIH